MGRMTIFNIIAVLILLVFAGCGSGEPVQIEQDQGSVRIEIASPAEPQNAAGDKPSEKNAGGSLSIATEKSAELPKGYHSDIFPLYEGSYIVTVIELEGSYTLTAFSKDEYQKVIAFYEKVMDGAQVIMDTKTDRGLASMGTKSGYAYSMDVGKSSDMEGYQTSIVINLQPE